jgi:hypothetical protein
MKCAINNQIVLSHALACIIHEHIVNSFLVGTRLPNTATAA